MINPESAGAEPTETSIAKAIQDKLTAQDMSKLQLSNLTGIPYATLRRRVDTGSKIMMDELSSIARALGADIRDFLPKPAGR